jgi:hypothetical protein
MEEHASVGHRRSGPPPKPASTVIIILIALVCGAGIFGTFYWLYSFLWIWFPSVLVVAAGCYLLFTRLSGPDHA